MVARIRSFDQNGYLLWSSVAYNVAFSSNNDTGALSKLDSTLTSPPTSLAEGLNWAEEVSDGLGEEEEL